ncbi:hypothetical protein ACU686_19990 [Yinghuangia aomiensis]
MDDETKKQYMVTNAVAECMKKAGFTYVPFVLAADSGEPRRQRPRLRLRPQDPREVRLRGLRPRRLPQRPAGPRLEDRGGRGPEATTAFQALPQDRKDAWNAAMMGSTDPAKMKQAMADGGAALGTAQTKVYGDKGKSKADAEAASEAARRNRLNPSTATRNSPGSRKGSRPACAARATRWRPRRWPRSATPSGSCGWARPRS